LAKAALRRHRHVGFGPYKSPNIVFTAEEQLALKKK